MAIMMQKIELQYVAAKYARMYDIEPAVIFALIEIESSWDTFAARTEPGWKYWFNVKYWARRRRITSNTERALQRMSLGLCQVMGTVAREIGLELQITVLVDPEFGCRYGCKKLRQLLNKYSNDLPRALSAYNTGRPNTRRGRIYYAKWLKVYNRIKLEVPSVNISPAV